MANRLRGRCGYPEDEPFRVTLHSDRLDEPLKWKKPRKVFVCSMGDLFHEDVPDEWIDQLVWEIGHTFQKHTFLVLTKRPERMRAWFVKAYKENLPYPNIWLGVTAENQQRADERIPILLQIPAAVRFVSVEPMLGPVDLSSWLDGYGASGPVLDWVICGGETGPNARPMHSDWVRSLRYRCQETGVPFFFKQWGEYVPCDYEGMDFGASYIDSQCINGELWDLDNCDSEGRLYSTGDNPTCPKCKGSGFLRVGKKASGRFLDGREWNEFPEVTP